MLNTYSYTIMELLESGVEIFDFTYPLYVDDLDVPDTTKYALRKQFEKFWLNHYLYSQIGFPTVQQFKHFLEDTFKIEMPYINELFRLSALEYDPIYAYYLKENSKILDEGVRSSTEETSGTSEGETSNTSELHGGNQSDTLNKFLDTPENNIQNLYDGKFLTNVSQRVDNGSSYSDSLSEGTSSGRTSGNFTGNYQEDNEKIIDRTLLGNIGNLSAGEILLKTAQSKDFFLHTMKELFNRCDDLFMLIY